MSTRTQRKAAKRRRDASRAEFQWREGQRRIAQHGRDLRKDANDANSERHKAAATINGIYAKASADAQRGADALRAKYTAEAKALCTKPVTSYAGATMFLPGGVSVTHWALPLPDDIAARVGVTRQVRGGPLAVLPPGGGNIIPAVNVLDSADSALRGIPAFVEWARASARVWCDEVKDSYQLLLKRLRDDSWWAHIAEQCGLTRKDDTEDTITTAFGIFTRKRTVIRVPTLVRVAVTRTGLTLIYQHMAGHSAKSWQAKADALAAAFKAAGGPAGDLRIGEDSAGNITVYFNDRDPFLGTIESGTFDTVRMRSLLGITASGEPAWITWAGSSGMVIGGVPGSGKTASLMPVFAGMAGRADLYVFDGKGQHDMHPLRHIAQVYDRSGDLNAPLATLEKLERERTARGERMYDLLGANNFWNLSPEQRARLTLKPIFLILDECQTWLDTSGLTEKEEKATSAQIVRLVRTLIQKGRASGIVTILTTQKPDSGSIPTIIRDNAALKACFHVSTPEQAITVLGRQSADAPDPTKIPMAAKGRCVMETEGQGVALIQGGYVENDELERLLSAANPQPEPPGGGDPAPEPPGSGGGKDPARHVPGPGTPASQAVSMSSAQPAEESEWTPSPQFLAARQLAVSMSMDIATTALTAALAGTGPHGLPAVGIALYTLVEHLEPEEIGVLIAEVHRQAGTPAADAPAAPARALQLVPPPCDERPKTADEMPGTATDAATDGGDALDDMMRRLRGEGDGQ